MNRMFAPVTQLFREVSEPRDYRRSDYVMLWLLLAIGVLLRFWGLDNVGLHGDEETMAMPAMAILDQGEPILPSGMYYARALIQIYMMSGSVWIFGESEWALRLPSAIVGSLTGLAAFFMGQRFLSPQFNLALVATITFLPGLIEISQTARMYVFFVTCMIWFSACIFRWEHDQKPASLILALIVWLLCLHFHTLAIFAAPLFLYPGLSRQSWTQLIQGGLTFVIGGALFFLYDNWISAKYPDTTERPPPVDTEASQTSLEVLTSGNEWIWVTSTLFVAALAAVAVFRIARHAGWSQVLPVVLAGLGLLAMAALQYHVGGLLLLFGILFWLRSPKLSRSWLVATILIAAVLTAVHLGVLYQSGLYPGRKIIGALIGMPSVWPLLRFLEYAPIAGALYALAFTYASVRFVNGQRLPIHFLYFVMAVWAPLVILGFFAWYVPPRYTIGQLGYFLLCVFAGLAYVAYERKWATPRMRLSRRMILVLVVVTTLLVNPIAFIRTVDAGYEEFPDHKGAAEFIQSLNLSPDAILIAEDVLQQTYYLGEVDYSLRPVTDAVVFSYMKDGLMIDQYTGAPVIGTGDELASLLDAKEGTDIYIIGSGENWVGHYRLFRTEGIDEVLASDRLEVVYEGRDGKTTVWKARRRLDFRQPVPEKDKG